MGDDVLSWSDLENLSAADVLGRNGAYSFIDIARNKVGLILYHDCKT